MWASLNQTNPIRTIGNIPNVTVNTPQNVEANKGDISQVISGVNSSDIVTGVIVAIIVWILLGRK